MSQMVDWELSPAPESTSHVQIDDTYGLFINGQFQESQGGSRFDSINPATEQKLSSITEASEADVDAAVKSARNAADLGPGRRCLVPNVANTFIASPD